MTAAFRYADRVRGRFITFEGIEGVGKSTQITRAAAFLRGRGVDPVLTREPGGTALAEQLRSLVLDPRDEPVPPTVELLVLFAARASHVSGKIRPALNRGRWVLCDRFTDATEAYQGSGRGLRLAWIRQLARIAHPRLTPHLTFLFDAPAEIALGRMKGRGSLPDRIEGEAFAFFERVRSGYLAIAAREPERIRLIDATDSEEQVAAAVAHELEHCLRDRK